MKTYNYFCISDCNGGFLSTFLGKLEFSKNVQIGIWGHEPEEEDITGSTRVLLFKSKDEAEKYCLRSSAIVLYRVEEINFKVNRGLITKLNIYEP